MRQKRQCYLDFNWVFISCYEVTLLNFMRLCEKLGNDSKQIKDVGDRTEKSFTSIAVWQDHHRRSKAYMFFVCSVENSVKRKFIVLTCEAKYIREIIPDFCKLAHFRLIIIYSYKRKPWCALSVRMNINCFEIFNGLDSTIHVKKSLCGLIPLINQAIRQNLLLGSQW